MKAADLTMASGRGRKFKGGEREAEDRRNVQRGCWLQRPCGSQAGSRKCHGKDGKTIA